jgi:hypothetical protein
MEPGMKSTPEMRARIRELMTSPQDDYDRAVECVLDDLEGMLNVAQSGRAPGEEHPVLKQADELHDLGFNAGWNGAIEEAAKLVDAFDCHLAGYPNDEVQQFYESGVADACNMLEERIRAIAAQPPAAPVETDASRLADYLVKLAEREDELSHDCDMRPEDTANFEYAKQLREAAAYIRGAPRSSAGSDSAYTEEVTDILESENRNLRRKLKLSDNLLDGLTATIDSLKAELAEARSWTEPQSAWQPIETAPRDGSRFLGWCAVPIGEEPRIVTWTRGAFYAYGVQQNVTHWQPLPGSPISRPQHLSGDAE